MFRSRLFHVGLLYMLVCSAVFIYLNYRTAMRSENVFYVEDALFNLFPMIGPVTAIVTALHLGAEYDHGTIRNKLMVGHTRWALYWSDLAVCTVASVVLLLVMLAVSGLVGYVLFRAFLLPAKDLALLLLCAVLITMVFAAMFVAVSVAVPNRAFSVVACWVLFYAMMLVSSYLQSILAAEEMTYSYVMISQSGVEFGDLIENPDYVDGPQRTVFEFIDNLLPTGQAAHLNNMEFENARHWPWMSAAVWLFSVAMGWLGFRRRDIK